ncbi:MAG: UDP-N-acetylenolpyruvoylglucosamine reductase [Deltaproteobacteria bacterium HGW-Deltaproteobacteria-15]|nr:MAG: UDP-N-acetylenolpyruvoylglucosamine reductase [Deltaproteobacteria bacterium HGW-Deltaproteobacteria-15]
MDERQRREIREIFGEDVLFDCPMSRYTTFRVGGNAKALCTCREMSRLEWVVSYGVRERLPFLVIGRGSNLLFKDSGFDGMAIRLAGDLAGIVEVASDPPLLKAGGGAPLSELLSYCRKRGLSGLEFLVGVPGTAGGAAAMNAGAWGMETGQVIREISMVDPGTGLLSKDRSELRFGYRSLSIPKGAVIVRVVLGLVRDDPQAVSARMAEYLSRRKAGQPLDHPSGGSVFKNPPGDFAGRLIEKAGLKGEKVGGAMISPKHANFIVNVGGASAGDVLALMELARKRVWELTRVELEPEIRVVG